MYSVCAVLHRPVGRITTVLFFLYIAAGIQNFTVLASEIGVKDKKIAGFLNRKNV